MAQQLLSWANLKVQKGCTNVDVKLWWDFDVENITVKLQSDAGNFWWLVMFTRCCCLPPMTMVPTWYFISDHGYYIICHQWLWLLHHIPMVIMITTTLYITSDYYDISSVTMVVKWYIISDHGYHMIYHQWPWLHHDISSVVMVTSWYIISGHGYYNSY